MAVKSVLTCAPLRISLLGGGTDFSSYYSNSFGAVLAAAIDQYVYVHIKKHDPLFQERYRISYSEVEHCQSRKEIKNDIVRASLQFLEIDEPLQISTSADLPANSGLGSSSSFAVALLLGLHELKGEKVGAVQLAEEACKVEIEILGSPIGKQDQYASALGGLNLIEFKNDDTVVIEPISTQYEIVKDLFNNSSMIWTQQSRQANSVLTDQEKRASENQQNLDGLRDLVYKLRDEFRKSDPSLQQIGNLISQGWEIKKNLSPLILTAEISELFEEISVCDLFGSKLLGAGAGGFILSIHKNLNKDLETISNRWAAFSPRLDHSGARILSSN
jgi:D-glycero-alpha-D-manno-heptose-7-phosphate kinase